MNGFTDAKLCKHLPFCFSFLYAPHSYFHEYSIIQSLLNSNIFCRYCTKSHMVTAALTSPSIKCCFLYYLALWSFGFIQTLANSANGAQLKVQLSNFDNNSNVGSLKCMCVQSVHQTNPLFPKLVHHSFQITNFPMYPPSEIKHTTGSLRPALLYDTMPQRIYSDSLSNKKVFIKCAHEPTRRAQKP